MEEVLSEQDRKVLREIKESGNYTSLVRFKNLYYKMASKKIVLEKLIFALKNPENYFISTSNEGLICFDYFLEKNGIKFSF